MTNINHHTSVYLPSFIEQCNFPGLDQIDFFSWYADDALEWKPVDATVAIFKIKYK